MTLTRIACRRLWGGLAVAAPQGSAAAFHQLPHERLLLSVNNAAASLDISRSQLYREISAGNLQAVKIGTKTMVTMASVQAFVTALPNANIRPAA